MNEVSTSAKGKLAEDCALKFLEKQGLSLIRRNYSCPAGEIDLIMRDKDKTAFIEVRSRLNENFINAVETIDLRKQKRIIKTSLHYLQNTEKYPSKYYRYDVVTIDGALTNSNIEWIKNAFDA